MKKFVAIYYAPAEAMAKMANITPEQAAEGMKPWLAWKERVGDAMVDFGAPLMPGQATTGDNGSASSKAVSGYSILQAKDSESCQALFENHPHTSWAPGCSIEIHECAAM